MKQKMTDEEKARRAAAREADQEWRYFVRVVNERVRASETLAGIKPQILDLIEADDTHERIMTWRAKEEAIRFSKLAAQPGTSCGVYFLSHGTNIKIGYSKDIYGRKKQYETVPNLETVPLGFQPCKSVAEARYAEFKTHQRFASIRIGVSEWFTDDGQIRAYIAANDFKWPETRPAWVD